MSSPFCEPSTARSAWGSGATGSPMSVIMVATRNQKSIHSEHFCLECPAYQGRRSTVRDLRAKNSAQGICVANIASVGILGSVMPSVIAKSRSKSDPPHIHEHSPLQICSFRELKIRKRKPCLPQIFPRIRPATLTSNAFWPWSSQMPLRPSTPDGKRLRLPQRHSDLAGTRG